jgi:predicted nucleic acid-binding Zn ribbon protein
MGDKGNTNSLGEVINKLIDSYRLRDKLNEVGIHQAWATVMGHSVNKRTDSLKISSRKLFVRLTSAPLRQELTFKSSEICRALNKELGSDILEEVIFR